MGRGRTFGTIARATAHRSVLAGVGGVALVAVALVGCGEQADDAARSIVDGAKDRAGEVADAIAEKGVGAVAEGRWRCDAEVLDAWDDLPGAEQEPQRAQLLVDIARDGRFAYADPRSLQAMAGTWEIDGLELRVSIPWDDDGSNGFYDWTYTADAEPPTHLSGHLADPHEGEQELEVEVKGLDEIRLVQHDVKGPDGPNYDLDVTCTRQSSDPGEIPPTVPPSDRDE